MNFDFNSTEKPLFVQVAEQIKDGIIKNIYAEETQIPSSTEISLTYKLNPATVNKGVNLLVEEGIVYKKRGIGMFVSAGAVKKLLKQRQKGFYESFIMPLLEEAGKLSISTEELIELIKENDNLKEHK